MRVAASVSAVAPGPHAAEPSIHVVVADRHAGFRQALARLLSSDARLRVVAEEGDLPHAGAALRRTGADALVCDVNLLEAGRGRLGPIPVDTTIVAVGMDQSPARRRHALQHGADAYVVKDHAHTQLVEALLRRG